MSTMYKKVSLNLHYFKDRTIIDYIEDEKERTNLSYSDILRLLILNNINAEENKAPKVQQPNQENSNKKPKFKFEG